MFGKIIALKPLNLQSTIAELPQYLHRRGVKYVEDVHEVIAILDLHKDGKKSVQLTLE